MKTINVLVLLFALTVAPTISGAKVRVVTTLSDYAWAARAVAGDHATVESLLPPNQDAHTLAPRPSYAVKVGRADLFVATGLDLEIWVPALLRRAGNARVRPGTPGYVNASEGVPMMDIPLSADRSQGDIHVHGNPHIHTSPVNMRFVIRNIAAGMIRVDPTNADAYTNASERVIADLDKRIFGADLVAAMGGDLTARLAARGRLFELLDSREYDGRPMKALIGGWLGRLQNVRGVSVATYHQNWAYLLRLSGLRLAAVAEPKPGIPPSPRHIATMVSTASKHNVKVLLAARYYPPDRVQTVSEKINVRAVRLPFHTGSDNTQTYLDLVEHWVKALEEVDR